MKRLTMLVGAIVVGLVAVGTYRAFAADSVASHATPALVDEINAILLDLDVGNTDIKPASGAGTLTVTGNETNDAVLVLDCDDGDNDADTWSIESENADNDLSFVNHTTERFKIDTSGNVTVGGDLTITGGDIIGDIGVTGGDITGANTNSIDIGEVADGTITFKRATSGAMTLTSLDDDANAALTVSAGGTGALTLGDSGSTTAITSSDWAIDATGIATGLGNVTSDGTVQGAGLKSASAGITIISGAYTGVLNIVSTTLTFVVNGTTTNVLDADITN